MRSVARELDDVVDRALERVRGHPALDRVFYGASEVADFSLVWFLLGALRSLDSDDELRELMRLAAVIGAESLVVNQGVKRLFGRRRPEHRGRRPYRLRQPSTSSFPSGHASAAFAAATVLSEGSRLAPLYYAIAAVVASSRVYVKIHHASDVIAGAAVGVAFGVAVRKLWPRDASRAPTGAGSMERSAPGYPEAAAQLA